MNIRLFFLLTSLALSHVAFCEVRSPRGAKIISGELDPSTFLSSVQANAVSGARASGSASPKYNESVMVSVKEVYPVVSPPKGVKECKVYLAKNHIFDKKSVLQTNYAVPSGCGKVWKKVILTIKGQVDTYQYSRVLRVFLDRLQIAQSSTVVSLYENGTKWTHAFDVTKYSSYFLKKRTATIILPNYLVSTSVLGVFKISAFLSFYNGAKSSIYPDVILPLSSPSAVPSPLKLTRQQTSYNVPRSNIPQNAYRILLEINVNPNGTDAFTFFSVPKKYKNALPFVTSDRNIFHTISAYVDGVLAGTVWPRSVISPNDLNFNFWYKSVGIGAFDSPSYFIDITPFVGSLVNGKLHNFKFAVSNIAANASWYVSGALHIWVDSKRKQTSGKLISAKVPSVLLKEYADFSSLDYFVKNGKVEVAADLAYKLSGYVVTSFGNLTTTITVKNSFFHFLKSVEYSSALQSFQKTSISTNVLTKDKKGKVWYSLSESNIFPTSLTFEDGFIQYFVTYEQAVYSSRTLVYYPGKKTYKKVSNNQKGAGALGIFSSDGNAYQRLSVKERPSSACYSTLYHMGGFGYIFADTTSQNVC